MVCIVLMFALVVVAHAYGLPPLPSLPMKDGCYVVSAERETYRMEGDAIILSFPTFTSVLKKRKIAPPAAEYLITGLNGTEVVAYGGEGRVQQHHTQLWLLPAKASDSGEYICTYRNDTYCITGRIKLHVYESGAADMSKLSYPINVTAGREFKFRCPYPRDVNRTGALIEWYEGSSPMSLQLGSAGSVHKDRGSLIIPAVSRSHAGLYTCQVRVLINNQQFNISNVLLLRVQGPVFPPPLIISPLNGTALESVHGSALELSCNVLTECQLVNSTVVMWLVNSQPLETSYLDRWAVQGERRVSKLYDGCQIELRLAVFAMTEEEIKTELKCVTQNQGGRKEVVTHLQLEGPEDNTFTWLVVAVVALSCFLTVVSVFLCVLCKPKRKKNMDYILARQNSTF